MKKNLFDDLGGLGFFEKAFFRDGWFLNYSFWSEMAKYQIFCNLDNWPPHSSPENGQFSSKNVKKSENGCKPAQNTLGIAFLHQFNRKMISVDEILCFEFLYMITAWCWTKEQEISDQFWEHCKYNLLNFSPFLFF
jgi:hypothetical protein